MRGRDQVEDRRPEPAAAPVIWQCLNVANGETVADDFRITTNNFGDDRITVRKLVMLCEDAIKTRVIPGAPATSIGKASGRVYACYTIAGSPVQQPFLLTTANFGPDSVRVTRPALMCEPARKTPIPNFPGTEDTPLTGTRPAADLQAVAVIVAPAMTAMASSSAASSMPQWVTARRRPSENGSRPTPCPLSASANANASEPGLIEPDIDDVGLNGREVDLEAIDGCKGLGEHSGAPVVLRQAVEHRVERHEARCRERARAMKAPEADVVPDLAGTLDDRPGAAEEGTEWCRERLGQRERDRVDALGQAGHRSPERGSGVGQSGAVEMHGSAKPVREVGHGRGLGGGQHRPAGEVVGVLQHHGAYGRRATTVGLGEGALDLGQVETAAISLEQPRHEAAPGRDSVPLDLVEVRHPVHQDRGAPRSLREQSEQVRAGDIGQERRRFGSEQFGSARLEAEHVLVLAAGRHPEPRRGHRLEHRGRRRRERVAPEIDARRRHAGSAVMWSTRSGPTRQVKPGAT